MSEASQVAAANNTAGNTPKVSVIVPVYNTEKYIERCLNSLLTQTFGDIEIIVINDGSTDKSMQAIERLAEEDSRIKVIEQANQKQGAARNRGLEIAKGDFITFIDADDWVDIDYIDKMYHCIKKHDTDIAVASVIRIKASGKFRRYSNYTEEIFYTGFNNLAKTLKIPSHWQVWGILYKKEVLDGLRFEENVYYEDPEFLTKALHNTKTMITVPGVKYYYFVNYFSTMRLKQTIAKLEDKVNAKINVVRFMKENNIKFQDFIIEKERNLFYTVKHYQNRKDFYLFGVKIFSKDIKYEFQKTFLIINTPKIDDPNESIISISPLCQNIKMIYPDSKVVLLIHDNNFDEAIKLDCIDDVIIYNEDEYPGRLGFIDFVKGFIYKYIHTSFIIDDSFKSFVVAKMLNSRYVFRLKKNSKYPQDEDLMEFFQKLTHKKLIKFSPKFKTNHPTKNLDTLETEQEKA